MENIENDFREQAKKWTESEDISMELRQLLSASREKVKMPVIGSGETSIYLASQIGNAFSILSPLSNNKENFNRKWFFVRFFKYICPEKVDASPL